jgi:hypothetical protein
LKSLVLSTERKYVYSEALRKVYTGKIDNQYYPEDHKKVLCKFHKADVSDVSQVARTRLINIGD